MNRLLLPLLALGILLGGCSEHTTAPPPIQPPAAPRGLFSVTGDHQVTLVWLENTEPDLAGYRIYDSPCGEPDCDYTRIGAIPASGHEYAEYVVSGLNNGETRWYAVAAVNQAGVEGDLSYNYVRDTPRPAGTGLPLNNFIVYSTGVGYDFSAFARTNTTDPPTDIFYGYYEDTTGYVHQQIFVPDWATNIQDAGYVTSLDMVDFAPDSGWSPSGTVEAIQGHAYVVWTRTNNFAKFRVTAVGPAQVALDWAYQIDPGNGELGAKPAIQEGALPRRPIVWLHH